MGLYTNQGKELWMEVLLRSLSCFYFVFISFYIWELVCFHFFIRPAAAAATEAVAAAPQLAVFCLSLLILAAKAKVDVVRPPFDSRDGEDVRDEASL